jgi:hypothetical protein
MKDIGGVIDYTPIDAGDWRAIGMRRVFAPLGYHEQFEFDHIPDPKYDVSMLGTMGGQRSSRRIILDKFSGMSVCHPYLEDVPKINFQEASESEVDAHTQFFLGAGKIFLHINRKHSVDNFPDIRVIQLGFSNRRFVLMDRCEWYPSGFMPGVHCGVADGENLHELAREYLRCRDAMSFIANNAYYWVKTNYRLEDNWREPIKEVVEWI